MTQVPTITASMTDFQFHFLTSLIVYSFRRFVFFFFFFLRGETTRQHPILNTAVGAILAAVTSVAAVAAPPVPFTWDPSAASPGLASPFTADSISMTDFLLNWQAQSNDTFILQINGFSLNGAPVSVPGLGTTFGLYLRGQLKWWERHPSTAPAPSR